MSNRFVRVVIFGLSLAFAVTPSELGARPQSANPLGVESQTKAMSAAMLRHRQTPYEKSPLGSYSNRLSLLMGGVEKAVNKVYETQTLSLGYHLTYSDQPSSIAKNPYVSLTKVRHMDGKSDEEKLLDRILAAKGALGPGQVLNYALDVTDGDYYRATLTAHNLLKEAAYSGGEGAGYYGWSRELGPEHSSSRLVKSDTVLGKLMNLRPANDKFLADKDGPWYHMFGVFFAGGVSSPNVASDLAHFENATRHLRLGSDPDPVKEEINSGAAAMGYVLADLARNGPYVPADLSKLTPAQLEALRNQVRSLHTMKAGELGEVQRQEAMRIALEEAKSTASVAAIQRRRADHIANAYRGLLGALQDEVKRIDREQQRRKGAAKPVPPVKAGKKPAQWEFQGVNVPDIKEEPSRDPRRFFRWKASGAEGSLTVTATWNDMQLKDHSCTSALTWNVVPSPRILVPGSKLKITGLVAISGEFDRSLVGINWHPPGFPAHVGHTSGINVYGKEVFGAGTTTPFAAETVVPDKSRFPDGTMVLRFITSARGYGAVEYLYKWVEAPR